MKSRIPPIIAVPLILIGGFFILSFSCLYVGTKNFNKISDQYSDADSTARAFAEYPKSHDGRYPSFKSSAEAFAQLRSLLEKEASKVSEEGHHDTTIERLESMAMTAVWNTALSGKTANTEYNAPIVWIFYVPAVLSKERYVVGYTDGKYTNKARSQLPEIFGSLSKN